MVEQAAIRIRGVVVFMVTDTMVGTATIRVPRGSVRDRVGVGVRVWASGRVRWTKCAHTQYDPPALRTVTTTSLFILNVLFSKFNPFLISWKVMMITMCLWPRWC